MLVPPVSAVRSAELTFHAMSAHIFERVKYCMSRCFFVTPADQLRRQIGVGFYST